MDVKNEIQHQIDVNCGSETRVITRTMQNCRCIENVVCSNIGWLIDNDYIQVIYDPAEMTKFERTYYESDSCRILRNVVRYNEAEYYEKVRKEEEKEASLSNIEKFKVFLLKMEKEFERKNLSNGKNYELNYGENDVTISSEGKIIANIDFENTCDWNYNTQDNTIFYKCDGKYYTIEIYYLWGKSYLKHY